MTKGISYSQVLEDIDKAFATEKLGISLIYQRDVDISPFGWQCLREHLAHFGDFPFEKHQQNLKMLAGVREIILEWEESSNKFGNKRVKVIVST